MQVAHSVHHFKLRSESYDIMSQERYLLRMLMSTEMSVRNVNTLRKGDELTARLQEQVLNE